MGLFGDILRVQRQPVDDGHGGQWWWCDNCDDWHYDDDPDGDKGEPC